MTKKTSSARLSPLDDAFCNEALSTSSCEGDDDDDDKNFTDAPNRISESDEVDEAETTLKNLKLKFLKQRNL